MGSVFRNRNRLALAVVPIMFAATLSALALTSGEHRSDPSITTLPETGAGAHGIALETNELSLDRDGSADSQKVTTSDSGDLAQRGNEVVAPNADSPASESGSARRSAPEGSRSQPDPKPPHEPLQPPEPEADRERLELLVTGLALEYIPAPEKDRGLEVVASPTTHRSTALIAFKGGKRPYVVTQVVDGRENFFANVAESGSLVVPAMPGVNRFVVTDDRGMRVSTTVDIRGRAWLLEPATARLARWDADATTVTVAATGYALSGARNLAVRASDENVFVVEQHRNRVVRFDADGRYLAHYEVPGAFRLQDVTFDNDGSVYVIDRFSRPRVFKLDSAITTVAASVEVTMPPGVAYPVAGQTVTHIAWHPASGSMLARVNSFTIALIQPGSMTVTGYRFSQSPLLVPGWDADPLVDRLFVGFHPGRIAAEDGFVSDPLRADFNAVNGAGPQVAPSWHGPTRNLGITDLSVDAAGHVWSLESQPSAFGQPPTGTVATVYAPRVILPNGSPNSSEARVVAVYDMPPATRVAVIR